MISYMSLLSVSNYSVKTWKEKFPDNKVKIEDLPVHRSWRKIFKEIIEESPEKIDELNDILSDCMKFNQNIFPYPDLIFSAFNKLPFDKIKVCFIGQDPYFNKQMINDKALPEAMGLSFSVPVGCPVPSSLKNIYKNAVNYGHFIKHPTHGNLEFWAYQGCLLLNTALTVEEKCPNSHASFWHWFTDRIIKKISDKLDGIVFVAWGKPAFNRSKNVDELKHKIIVSSHPSGLSCNTPMKKDGKPAFMNFDHFGEINKYLASTGKKQIVWQIADETT